MCEHSHILGGNPTRILHGPYHYFMSPERSAAAADDIGPEPSQPAGAAGSNSEQLAAILKRELTARSDIMFVVGDSWPVASGRGRITKEVTKQLIHVGWEVISDLCDALGKELSRSFGNFDKAVGLGWLLGDLVLGGLMLHEDAFRVGRKAAKLAPSLKAAFAAPLRGHGKAKYKTTEAAAEGLKAACQKEADLRSETVTLDFPSKLPRTGAKRQRTEADEPAPAPAAAAAHAAEPWYHASLNRLQEEMTMYVRFAEDAERRVVAETEVAKQASQASMLRVCGLSGR